MDRITTFFYFIENNVPFMKSIARNTDISIETRQKSGTFFLETIDFVGRMTQHRIDIQKKLDEYLLTGETVKAEGLKVALDILKRE